MTFPFSDIIAGEGFDPSLRFILRLRWFRGDIFLLDGAQPKHCGGGIILPTASAEFQNGLGQICGSFPRSTAS